MQPQKQAPAASCCACVSLVFWMALTGCSDANASTAITADEIVVDNTTNALTSTTLQQALNEELALDLASFLRTCLRTTSG